jgi:hypothetical protein
MCKSSQVFLTSYLPTLDSACLADIARLCQYAPFVVKSAHENLDI